mgnify:FL=1
MVLRSAFAVVSVLALVACESHSSVAPVVYRSDTTSQPTRIYQTPQQSAAIQQPVYRPAAEQAQTAEFEPVQLQPVSAVYIADAPQQQEVILEPSRSNPLLIEVRPGDTVYAIARRHDIPPQSIIAANSLQAPYALSVGQVLRLPERALVAAATPPQKAAAPVQKVVARDTIYRVHEGDTLYSISRKAGVPVASIAQANRLGAPYTISPGQQLLIPQAPVDSQLYAEASASNRVRKSEPAAQQRAVKHDPPPKANVADIAKTVSYSRPESANNSLFDWPVKGKVIANYGAVELGRRNDGVNIAAPTGTPVRAAADGEVVYRGSELDGFGNLLLVKHTDGYVTAYAHNDAMLVKKGDRVRKGQVIAKVGQTGAVSSPQLHFEIRQNLKSIDPVALLGSE